MSFNLVRNSRVFFTTNVNTNTGDILTTGLSATNTFEIQVQDGFTFGQATESETITLSEAGPTPARGQRAFNKALNPVDFSFSTYIRPKLSATLVVAEEKYLWNALMGDVGIGMAGNLTSSGVTNITRASTTAAVATINGTAMGSLPVIGDTYTVKGATGSFANEFNAPMVISSTAVGAVVGTYLAAPSTAAGTTCTAAAALQYVKSAWSEHISSTGAAANSLVTTANSNKNQLQPFGMIFIVDGITYLVNNCALDQASIDFGLDAIASIAWSGKGTTLKQAAAVTIDNTTPALPSFTGGLTGTATGKDTTAAYITNKLSAVTLQTNIAGTGTSTSYTVALTGGQITFANNLSYLTPANLGSVNTPIGYFTGTRAISGNLTAYLRGITLGTGQLLSDILASSATNTETKYRLQVSIGGNSAATRVEIEMDGAQLSVPAIEVQQVVSTTINFTSQGVTAITAAGVGSYDITQPNELSVRYYGV